MRPYALGGGIIQGGWIRSSVEVIPPWRNVVYVRRDDADNPMQMIGHDDACIQNYLITHLFRSAPFLYNNLAVLIELHTALLHFSEDALSIVGANRNEVRGCTSIVEAGVPRILAIGHTKTNV